MNRRSFLINLGIGAMSLLTIKELNAALTDTNADTKKMPALFVGHGNPMNAIEINKYHLKWQEIGKSIVKPKAILCISAHWETNGSKALAVEKPKTIHDFYGFPDELFKQEYNVPGSPEFAKKVSEIVKSHHVDLDNTWGLDHGAWSVLKPMFPNADIPTFQLSLDRNLSPENHFKIGKELTELRNKGVLIVGSGNIVHNLGRIRWEGKAHDWALEFDSISKNLIENRKFDKLIDYQSLGNAAKLSIPTNEHYLPMLYILGVSDKKDNIIFFNEEIDAGSISMRSFIVG